MVEKNSHIFFSGLPDFEAQAEEEKRLRKIPKAPSFSLEDMEQARKSAFEQGREEGFQQATQSIEQKTELLMQSVVGQINDLENQEQDRQDQYLENSIAISYQSLQKLLPAILIQEKGDLIINAIKTFLADNIPKGEMHLFVSPGMTKSVEKFIRQVSQSIMVKADKNMSDSQSRIEWVDGQFDYNPDMMIEEILAILSEKDGIEGKPLDESPKKPHNEIIDQESVSAPQPPEDS